MTCSTTHPQLGRCILPAHNAEDPAHPHRYEESDMNQTFQIGDRVRVVKSQRRAFVIEVGQANTYIVQYSEPGPNDLPYDTWHEHYLEPIEVDECTDWLDRQSAGLPGRCPEHTAMMRVIRTVYDGASNAGMNRIYDRSDGFGDLSGREVGWDWSGIRDSTPDAVVDMYAEALRQFRRMHPKAALR